MFRVSQATIIGLSRQLGRQGRLKLPTAIIFGLHFHAQKYGLLASFRVNSKYGYIKNTASHTFHILDTKAKQSQFLSYAFWHFQMSRIDI